jgi:small subunit ribosomal protein S6
MKQYELVYILHPDLEGNLEVATSGIQKLIGELDGRVLAEDVWGKRRLAYPIRKLGFGVYVVVTCELPGEQVGRLERELGLMDEVLRHLLVTVPKAPKRSVKTARVRKEKQPVSTQSESERLKALDEKLKEVIGESEVASSTERGSNMINIGSGDDAPSDGKEA